MGPTEISKLRREIDRARAGLVKDGFTPMAMTNAEHERRAVELHDRLLREHRARTTAQRAPTSDDELSHVERVVGAAFGRSKAEMLAARKRG